MRVYADCYELMSEILREVYEMGHLAYPNSMQNIIVKDNDDFTTKEIINYSYCLTSFVKNNYLFIIDPKAKQWADAEFEERIQLPSGTSCFKNPGEAWKLRSDVWKQFLNAYGEFDYTYHGRIDPEMKLELIINELKVNPDSRQCVLPIYTSSDIYYIGGEKRIPCSLYYQFLLRDKRLHIVYAQRSADVITHFGNDVYLAYKLMLYVAERIKIEPGYLFHNIGSLHSYKKDWGTLKKSINEIMDARS